jgi:basic amino acid/polyamine antiporter, APA family
MARGRPGSRGSAPSSAPAGVGGAVAEGELRKDLGTLSMAALIVGAIIGSGIFFLPGLMLAQTGGVWPVLAAFALGGLVALAGGLTFAELGAAFPKEGGQYAFLRDSLGKGWAFLFAWSGFAVVQSGTIAAVAVAMAGAVDAMLGGGLPGSTPCLGGAGADGACDGLRLPKWGVGFLAVAAIVALTLLNQWGVRRGAWVNNAAGLAKTAALLAIALLAFLVGSGVGELSSLSAFEASWGALTLGGFGLALANAMFAYDGFAQATFVAAEAKDARRTVPRAIVLGTLGIAAIYLLATAAYFHVLAPGDLSEGALAGDLPIASEAMRVVLGAGAALVVAGAVVVSTFGTVNTYVLTSPRIYHPIARDGDFPRAFGHLNRHGVPTYGLWYGALWAGFLTMTGSYAALANLVVFGLYVFYLATVVAYFVLRRREPQAFGSSGFRMPLRPVPVLFFALASVAVMLSFIIPDLGLLLEGRLLAFATSTTGLGLLLIGVGVLLYAFQRKHSAATA